MRILTIILITLSAAILFADPPDWEDIPGAYQFTATISGGIVLSNGEQMGEDGDMFAAFDEEDNVRGVGLMLLPPFGPYEGTPVWEMQMRSNAEGDLLLFKYYDASEDQTLNLSETYEFKSNEILGNVLNPVFIGGKMWILYNFDVAIGGFQFNIEGRNITGASGGAAEAAGFMISTSASTVIAFSVAGETIPIGEGKLTILDVEDSLNETCLTDLIVSDNSGNNLNATVANCNTIILTSVVEIDLFDECDGSVPENGVCPDGTPLQFQFEQSISQAFYTFLVVVINENEISPDDWVGAFNDNDADGIVDVCVGARRWGACGNGGVPCDVPVMGVDGNDFTEGYMLNGDIPIFIIYHAASNTYYDAVPSENYGFGPNGQFMIGSLKSTVFLTGCTDSNACNYNVAAGQDDGSCLYEDCAGVCGGSAVEDCNGDCGGSSVLDDCGVCGGSGVDTDSDGICDDVDDCIGTYDTCGICDGPGSIYECGCADVPDGDCDN